MIGLYNQNSSFFNIEKKLSGDTKDVLNNRIISFSITEEAMRMMEGSIEMYDPYNTTLDAVLALGTPLDISWGYKMPDVSLRSLMASLFNATEIKGAIERSGVKAVVMNISGSGNENGVIYYSANFIANEFYTKTKPAVYVGVTRGAVVAAAMVDLGCDEILIEFGSMIDFLSADQQIVQWEGSFRFLNRLAMEWGCVFSVGHGKMGKVGLFAEWDRQSVILFNNIVGSSFGGSIYLDYKQGSANVESYSFQYHANDSTGDNVQFVNMGSGNYVARRFVANSEVITDYAIDMNKIQQDILSKGGTADKIKFAAELLKVNSFQKLVDMQYFKEIRTSPAPQGYGWEVKVKMLGNPMITAPVKVTFGKGFPAILRGAKTSFWVRSVTHTVNEKGYHVDLSIIDALTFLGGTYIG